MWSVGDTRASSEARWLFVGRSVGWLVGWLVDWLVSWLVSLLLNVPAICLCITGTGGLRKAYVLPH